MKIAFFDAHAFERKVFDQTNRTFQHEIQYLDVRLMESTALLAKDFACVCAFANDQLDGKTLAILKQGGTQLLALRSAGFNHVDLKACKKLGMQVVRVPEYSPYAIAEHVVALIQTLNRHTHKAYNRGREGNFSLEGLVGFDLHGKTVGIIGAGRIGMVLVKIMLGFGCHLLLHDYVQANNLSGDLRYTSLDEIYNKADIISLHVPLTEKTFHLLDQKAFDQMKKGVMVINTGRGGLIDSKALIQSLKSGQVGYAGLDVYEEEQGVFFQDLSEEILTDDILARLMSFPNVLITGHQGFLTHEALSNIAQTTLESISEYEQGKKLTNEVSLKV